MAEADGQGQVGAEPRADSLGASEAAGEPGPGQPASGAGRLGGAVGRDPLPGGPAALPFTLRRSSDVVGLKEITTTVEKIHGLLRLTGDELVLQWRLSRQTERVGMQIRTDHELEEVREVGVPLSAIASARVRWLWFRWPPGRYLVLTASDLRAFEQAAGVGGMRLEHPAELVVRVRRGEVTAAQEFAGEVELAVAERALLAAARPRLNGPVFTSKLRP